MLVQLLLLLTNYYSCYNKYYYYHLYCIHVGGQSSESQAAMEQKERLRKLALETIDITKDPSNIRNNLGTFECKLCLTVHPNEGMIA
jgi:hypothetical protein